MKAASFVSEVHGLSNATRFYLISRKLKHITYYLATNAIIKMLSAIGNITEYFTEL